jgi:hypothetical protein
MQKCLAPLEAEHLSSTTTNERTKHAFPAKNEKSNANQVRDDMIIHARDARGWSWSVALLPTSRGREKGKVRMRPGDSYNATDTDKGP